MLIMACNPLCVPLSTAKILCDYDSAPSEVKAEGDLDATHICILRNSKEEAGPPPIEVEGNLSPDYLSNARKKFSAGAGCQRIVATGQYSVARPGITTTGQEALKFKDSTQPPNTPEAELFTVLKASQKRY